MTTHSKTGDFVKARLSRMGNAMEVYVDAGEIAGAVTLLARRDSVHVDAVGKQDLEAATPMRRDTIFRIANEPRRPRPCARRSLVEAAALRGRRRRPQGWGFGGAVVTSRGDTSPSPVATAGTPAT